MHTCVPLKRCMYTCTIINTCVTSTTKNICEDSCTTYIHMYHIHIHALPKNIHQHTCTIYTNMQNIHILAPPNTTKIEQYMCHIHHQKHMWGFMHHIHIHAPPRTYVRIHAPHTHTCTTYTYMHHQIPPKNKICLVDLTSELYERPDQNVSIHTPHTHTCTTKYHQKIYA